MIRAFAFVLTRTLKNFVRWRLRRLRQPRYLAATLAGAVYIWFTWARHIFLHRGHRTELGMEAWFGRYHDVAELLAALGLTLTVAIC